MHDSWNTAWLHMMDAMVEFHMAGATKEEVLRTAEDAWITYQWRLENYRKEKAESEVKAPIVETDLF